jgi:hypothetical protein
VSSLLSAERKDYLYGIILVFSIIVVVAFVWFMVLVLLKCLGHRVGCASGRPVTIPAESMSPDEELKGANDDTGEFIVMQADQNRVNRTRLFYFFCGLVCLAATGLAGYGVYNVQKSITEVYDNSVDLQETFTALPDTVDSLFTEAGTFADVRDPILVDLSTFCPVSSGLVNGEDPKAVTEAYMIALASIGDISQADSEWSDFRTMSDDTGGFIDKIVKYTSSGKSYTPIWFICTLIALGVILMITLFLISCAWNSGKEGYQFVGEDEKTCRNTMLINFASPLFGLLIAVFWIASSGLLCASVADADFCVDEITTGEGALKMVENMNFATDNYFYQMTDEYLHGCPVAEDAPIDLLSDYGTLLTSAQDAATKFQSMKDHTAALAAACGVDNTAITTIMIKSTTASNSLTDLQLSFDGLNDSLKCGTLAPPLQKTIYETGCNSLSFGLLLSFIGTLVISVFGTIMITLRSATLRPQIYTIPTGTDNMSVSKHEIDSIKQLKSDARPQSRMYSEPRMRNTHSGYFSDNDDGWGRSASMSQSHKSYLR